MAEELAYAIVRNIPKHYRSKHLRFHFSTFVEQSRFDCFHFKHRPEIKTTTSGDEKTETCCCFVRLTKENRRKFVKTYSNKHWTNETGGIDDSSLKCFITPAKIDQSGCETSGLNAESLKQLPEFNPPSACMPRGNVGTPSEYFNNLINNCRLPSSVIKSLGLNFGGKNGKRRIYGSVPPNDDYYVDEEKIARAQYGVDPDDGDDADDDRCQEFERHEALNDDVTSQERSKERLYEEEMEVVWEKGGSGLVFYTDAFHWDQQEGTDCDERWADDWDVDTGVYYPEDPATPSGGGTKDALDTLDIRRSSMIRDGKLEESVFKKPKTRRKLSRSKNIDYGVAVDFETHTKGVGRKVMEKHGWAPGRGLGRTFTGSLTPAAVELESDAQSPLSKKGLGYRGEKLQRFGLVRKPLKRTITTAFDKEVDQDPAEVLIRRLACTQNKWRR